MFPEMPRATGASPYTPPEELTENEEAAAEAAAEAATLEGVEITVGGQPHQASSAPSSPSAERMREMFEAAAVAAHQAGDPRAVGFEPEQGGDRRVESQEDSQHPEGVSQMQVEARPGRGGAAAPDQDIHSLLAEIRRTAHSLGHAWFAHKKKRAEFVHCFRQLQPRLAEIGTRDQQLKALIDLHSNLVADLHACRNDGARCALENGALDVAQIAALILRGDQHCLSVPVFQLAPVQCLHLLVEAHYNLDGDRSRMPQMMRLALLNMFSQHARRLHNQLQITIPNLLDGIPPDVRNGMRANTQLRINEALMEMRTMLANGQPLTPCQQCLKDLPRMGFSAWTQGVHIYENRIDDYADLTAEEGLAIRVNLLNRYLGRMPDASRMTTMAFLSQTMGNEMSDWLQMAIVEYFGNGFGVMSLGKRCSSVEMHRTRGGGMRMRFTMHAIPILMPLGPLGMSPIHYKDGSSIQGEVEVYIEQDGSYMIMPATLGLTLTGAQLSE